MKFKLLTHTRLKKRQMNLTKIFHKQKNLNLQIRGFEVSIELPQSFHNAFLDVFFVVVLKFFEACSARACDPTIHQIENFFSNCRRNLVSSPDRELFAFAPVGCEQKK